MNDLLEAYRARCQLLGIPSVDGGGAHTQAMEPDAEEGTLAVVEPDLSPSQGNRAEFKVDKNGRLVPVT